MYETTKDRMNMNFNNLEQAVISTRILQIFYHTIRIYDPNTGQLLYNSNDSGSSCTEVSSCIKGSHKSLFSIRENDGTLNVTVSIPITIAKQSCHLELIQQHPHPYDAGPSFLNTEIYSLRHMQKLIITDSLTSLYNRRYIDLQIPVAISKSFQNNEPVSFIYADIDCFKEINDHYGHITGDFLLKETALLFQKFIPAEDGWAARYGGDEFLFCLPGKNKYAALKTANQIRNAVAEHRFYVNKKLIHITCSFGVQTFRKSKTKKNVDQILEMVDKKLYQAKKKGRNKVAF